MKKRGFSLLELMVAVLITSMVIIAGFSLMTNAKDGFRNESSRKELEANLRNAELIVQRDLGRVGYHALMDSSLGIAGQPDPVSGIGAFQAFTVFDPVVTGENQRAEQFAFIADLTDYPNGFVVASQNDKELTVDAKLEVGRSSSEIAQLHKSQNHDLPGLSTVDQASFDAAFAIGFEHAGAIFAFSPTNQSAIIGLDESAPVDLMSHTVKLKEHPNPALDFVIGTPLKDVSVYPIIGITYRTVKAGGEWTLQRCYTKNLVAPGVGNDRVDGCQVVLRNIRSFELYPLTPSNINAFVTSADQNGLYKKSESHWLDGDRLHVEVDKIIGFGYRLEAAGVMSSNIAAGTPGYDDDGRPISVIQGTVLKSTMSSFAPSSKKIKPPGP